MFIDEPINSSEIFCWTVISDSTEPSPLPKSSFHQYLTLTTTVVYGRAESRNLSICSLLLMFCAYLWTYLFYRAFLLNQKENCSVSFWWMIIIVIWFKLTPSWIPWRFPHMAWILARLQSILKNVFLLIVKCVHQTYIFCWIRKKKLFACVLLCSNLY